MGCRGREGRGSKIRGGGSGQGGGKWGGGDKVGGGGAVEGRGGGDEMIRNHSRFNLLVCVMCMCVVCACLVCVCVCERVQLHLHPYISLYRVAFV